MADIAGESAALPGNRGRKRASMLLMATMKAVGDDARETHPIRIRNLSSEGLMAVSEVSYEPGESVEVGLRGMGIVAGAIVWVRDNRLGIVFRESIDIRRSHRRSRRSAAQD